MKLKTLIVAFAVAAVLPVAALADPAAPSDKVNGARACQALKTSLGEATFKATYGTNANKSNAMGQCVSKGTRGEHQNRHEASTACTAEQADANFAATHGGKTFAQFYGVGKKDANAMQRCVQSKRQAASTEDRQATANAAQKCKAERTTLGETAFKAKYGTNESKSNAFGKCVSTLAQAQQNS